MSFWAGLVGGFQQGMASSQERNAKLAADQSDKERRIFEALANSDDPEISALAITGMLGSAGPSTKKGGLRGWLGEVESSPILGQVRTLMGTPVTKTRQAPDMRSAEAGLRTNPAATPPPGPMGGVTEGMGNVVPSRLQATTESYQVPRQAFLSRTQVADAATQRAGEQSRVTGAGTVQGRIDGLRQSGLFSEAQIEDLVAREYGGRTTSALDAYRRPTLEAGARARQLQAEGFDLSDEQAADLLRAEQYAGQQLSPEDQARLKVTTDQQGEANRLRQEAIDNAAEGRQTAADDRAIAAEDRRIAAEAARKDKAEVWKQAALAKLEAAFAKETELVGLTPEREAKHERDKQGIQDSYLTQIGLPPAKAATPPPAAPAAAPAGRGGPPAQASGRGRGTVAGVPAWVTQALSAAQPNTRHTFDDGTVWDKLASGEIRQVK